MDPRSPTPNSPTLDFSQLHQGDDCPSDLVLERHLAGELSAEEEAELTERLESSPDGQARLEELRQGFASFEGVNPERMLQRIQARLANELEAEAAPAAPAEPARQPSLLERLTAGMNVWLGAGAAAAAAALILFVIPGPGAGGNGPDEITGAGGFRMKGGLALHVYRAKGDKSEAVLSGDKFSAGDRLRFEVDIPAKGRVAVVGVEADGDLYTAWPLGKAEGKVLSGGLKQKLDGAVELDAAPGPETFYLVHCGDVAPSCKSRGPKEAPVCAEGCNAVPFVLNK